jgi:hypothetical protein
MGIQSFTPSSGGLPGKSFIGNAFMTTGLRSWAQGGGPGYYSVVSSKGGAGYVYFIGASTVGAPLNGVADLTGGSGFTSIKIIGDAGDVMTLYKVAVKDTTGFSSTLNTTTITSTGTISIPTNQTGFIDAFLMGGGGGGGHGHHGGGGGGGGALILQSFPLTPGVSSSATVGAAGAQGQNVNGGDTLFAGMRAKGGGFGRTSHTANGGDGGCGGGGSVHNGSCAGGASTQGTGVSALAAPLLFLSSYGTTATAEGFGTVGSGGSYSSGHHGGFGGGGAGAAASGHNGGSGYLLSWNSTYYGAGGRGARHAGNGSGYVNGTGWGNPGSGAASNANPDSSSGDIGTAGVIIIRSYSI